MTELTALTVSWLSPDAAALLPASLVDLDCTVEVNTGWQQQKRTVSLARLTDLRTLSVAVRGNYGFYDTDNHPGGLSLSDEPAMVHIPYQGLTRLSMWGAVGALVSKQPLAQLKDLTLSDVSLRVVKVAELVPTLPKLESFLLEPWGSSTSGMPPTTHSNRALLPSCASKLASALGTCTTLTQLHIGGFVLSHTANVRDPAHAVFMGWADHFSNLQDLKVLHLGVNLNNVAHNVMPLTRLTA